MLLKTGQCFTDELALNCPTVVACVTALPAGPAAVAGDLVLGKDGLYHALPAQTADTDAQQLSIAGNVISLTNGGAVTLPPTAALPDFATPAEAVAGTSTSVLISPATLTDKLANQPAAGVCADRDDVVWDGTLLRGAPTQYNFSGAFPSIYFAVGFGVTVAPGVLATQSVTITNPSDCRTLRVTFDSSAGAAGTNVSTSNAVNVLSEVAVGSTVYLTNLGQEMFAPTFNVSAMGSGIISKDYLDIAPGDFAVVDYSLILDGTPLTFTGSGQIRAFVTYSAQTI